MTKSSPLCVIHNGGTTGLDMPRSYAGNRTRYPAPRQRSSKRPKQTLKSPLLGMTGTDPHNIFQTWRQQNIIRLLSNHLQDRTSDDVEQFKRCITEFSSAKLQDFNRSGIKNYKWQYVADNDGAYYRWLLMVLKMINKFEKNSSSGRELSVNLISIR